MKVAKAKGRLRGKQPKLNRRQEAHLVSLVHSGEYSTAEVADLFGVGRSTVYRAIERQRIAAKAGPRGSNIETLTTRPRRRPASDTPAGRRRPAVRAACPARRAARFGLRDGSGVKRTEPAAYRPDRARVWESPRGHHMFLVAGATASYDVVRCGRHAAAYRSGLTMTGECVSGRCASRGDRSRLSAVLSSCGRS